MSSRQKHWVEDLFPPKFGFTLEELLQSGPVPDSCRPSSDTNEKEVTSGETKPDATPLNVEVTNTSQKQSVFKQLARRVSPLDITAIKNVYERVWLMTYLEEEERKKREDAEEESDAEISMSFQRSSTPIQGHSPGRKTATKRTKVKNAETSTSDINEKAPLDVQDSCIWSSNEINVLRAVFQTAKEQNCHLQAQVTESQFQYEKLEQKYKTKCKEFDSRSGKLKEAVKANERLTILARNLKQEVDKATDQIEGFRNQIKSLKEDRSKLLQDTHELRVTADRERLERKKAELELQQQTQEALRDQRLHEDNLKVMHEEDIQYLQQTIEELTKELGKERQDHERTKRGLNHLRQHFASLPLQGEAATQGVVAEDQLKKWTY